MNDQERCEEFLEQQRFRKLEKSTINNQERMLKRWLTFLEQAGKNLNQAQPSDLVDWITLRTKTLKRETVRRELCILRKLHFFLKSFDYCDFNPCKSLPKMICEPVPEQGHLSIDECFKILDQIDLRSDIGLRDYTAIALLWSTGLRPFELSALKCKDIDLEQATLLVRKGKGSKQRQIFLNDHLLEKLKDYMEELDCQGDYPLFCSLNKNSGFAPPIEQRKAMPRGTLGDLIQKHARAAEITTPVTAMTFRHTFATHMFEAGVEIDDIKEMLGHDLDTESCVYIHVSVDCARKMLNAHQANPLYNKGFDK